MTYTFSLLNDEQAHVIAVYERSGFRPTCTFLSRTDSGDTEFVAMVRLRY